MQKKRLVVIGGDAAGMSAASVVRRRRPDMDIVVLEKGGHTSYAACGIPYYVGGLIQEDKSLVARSPEQFIQVGIDIRLHSEVVAIDPSARQVNIRHNQQEYVEPWDSLLIATGARPIVPNIPGVDGKNVFTISGLQDGIDLGRAIDAQQPGRVVVVGGGYIGVEMAEAMLRRGWEVHLVEMASQILATFDGHMAAYIQDAMSLQGIVLHLEEGLEALVTKGDRVVEVNTSKGSIATDMVIMAIGVRPNSELARLGGMSLGVRDSIVVNERMETSIEGIWAAGDCVQTWHRVSRRPAFVPLATGANKQGWIAGRNICGEDVPFTGVVGTAITMFGELEAARTGLNARECEALSIFYESVTIQSKTRAKYYPGHAPMTLTLLAQKDTGRLLGGQIVGGQGSGKQIDVVATALQADWTIDALLELDLAYAPPFGPVWAPVQMAARLAQSRRGKTKTN